MFGVKISGLSDLEDHGRYIQVRNFRIKTRGCVLGEHSFNSPIDKIGRFPTGFA